MDSGPLRRSIAWLCLALALVMSVVPRQSLLVCIESDGCVTVEAPTAVEHCDACEPHATEEHAPAPAPDGGVCACVDVELPGFAETLRRAAPARAELALVDFAFERCAVFVVEPAQRAPFASRAAAPPRPPDLLARLRTVELRI